MLWKSSCQSLDGTTVTITSQLLFYGIRVAVRDRLTSQRKRFSMDGKNGFSLYIRGAELGNHVSFCEVSLTLEISINFGILGFRMKNFMFAEVRSQNFKHFSGQNLNQVV